MVYAQKCADENSNHCRQQHGFLRASVTGRDMGQSIYFGGGPVEHAIRTWYEEFHAPGYDFQNPGYQRGTTQFTALIWYDTTHVGMARSTCGKFLVANYFPPGNWEDEEQYRKNVLPLQAEYNFRPRNLFEQKICDHFLRLAHEVSLKGITSRGLEGPIEPQGANHMVVPLGTLYGLLKQMGEHKLADAVLTSDADGDGNINAGEFLAAATTVQHSDMSNSKMLEKSVRRIVGYLKVDINGDNKLDAREFRNYLNFMTGKIFTEDAAQEMLETFDIDKNGYLDYQEIMALHDSGGLQPPYGSVLFKEWNKELQQMLADVPAQDTVAALRFHLKSGRSARVKKSPGRLSVILIFETKNGQRRMETLEKVWGHRRSV